MRTCPFAELRERYLKTLKANRYDGAQMGTDGISMFSEMLVNPLNYWHSLFVKIRITCTVYLM